MPDPVPLSAAGPGIVQRKCEAGPPFRACKASPRRLNLDKNDGLRLDMKFTLNERLPLREMCCNASIPRARTGTNDATMARGLFWIKNY